MEKKKYQPYLMSPEAYVPAHTGTYCLVTPYTRCTGFQMLFSSFKPSLKPSEDDHSATELAW